MSPLAEALCEVESRVGDVVRPRLRAIARGEDKHGRERTALAAHVAKVGHPDLADEAATLTPEGASALAAELGVSLRGRPTSATARSVRVEVLLTEDEAADLDRRRGEVGRSEWLARAAGLR